MTTDILCPMPKRQEAEGSQLRTRFKFTYIASNELLILLMVTSSVLPFAGSVALKNNRKTFAFNKATP
ncbi:hypothetical protein EI94DRAFT_1789773 [Lactarius quietus]|nr:hypothetical protein EI94DRAFT_1789773 [Lactarius quietus]